MYFVIRCNYIDKLTNKCTVGFFSTLSQARKLVTEDLIQDPKRDLVVIAKYETGLAYYIRPEEVFRWSDAYHCYVPVTKDDIVNKILIKY